MYDGLCSSHVLVVTLLWLATGMVLAHCRSLSDDDARRLTRGQNWSQCVSPRIREFGFRISGKFLPVDTESWALESGIQLKESRNPSSSDKEPESTAWNLESKTRGVLPLWPIRGCIAGQGLVFVLSVLYRVYNFAPVCPKQGNKIEGFCPKQSMYFRNFLVLNRVRISNPQWLTSTQIKYWSSTPRDPRLSWIALHSAMWLVRWWSVTDAFWTSLMAGGSFFFLSFFSFFVFVFGLCNLFMN